MPYTRSGRIELWLDAQGQLSAWRLEALVDGSVWTHTTGEVGPFDSPAELADALAEMLVTDIRWPEESEEITEDRG